MLQERGLHSDTLEKPVEARGAPKAKPRAFIAAIDVTAR
jgi:hypothetical protein